MRRDENGTKTFPRETVKNLETKAEFFIQKQKRNGDINGNYVSVFASRPKNSKGNILSTVHFLNIKDSRM